MVEERFESGGVRGVWERSERPRGDGKAREQRYSCTMRRLPSGEWAAVKIYVIPTS